MQEMRTMFLQLVLLIGVLLTPAYLLANKLFDNNPEFELANGDYNEIIHYDPLIFLDNKLENKSEQKLKEIVQEIKQFQNESKKVTIFIEGNTQTSKLTQEQKITKSQEYALYVKKYLVENNITDAKMILSARGDKNPYFTDIVEDVNKLSNRVMLSLYMLVPNDNDGDGVYSDKDKCPFSKYGTYVGENGCAVKNIIALVQGEKTDTAIVVSTKKASVVVNKINNLVAIEAKNKAPIPPVYVEKEDIEKYFGEVAKQHGPKEMKYLFYFDGTKILDEPKNKLQEMLQRLRNEKSLPYIQIIGHTDKKGNDAYNQALGLKRARIIENIILNAKIPVLKMDVESYGEANPIIKTADGMPQKLNRRVEVFIH
ncbi:OmpA family protein [Sulfurimonas sp.]